MPLKCLFSVLVLIKTYEAFSTKHLDSFERVNVDNINTQMNLLKQSIVECQICLYLEDKDMLCWHTIENTENDS